MENKVTPFEVEGNVDYKRLITEFGVKKIDKKLLNRLEKISKKPLHIFLKRNLFYAEMDLDKILDDVEAGKSIFLYTGRAPGGNMHIGHLIPFLFSKYLQDIFDCNLYIQIPDDEKFLFKSDLKQTEINIKVREDLLEISGIGFDENKTFIFKNTEYIKQLYPKVLQVAEKLTFSQVRNTFGFENSSNIGKIFYPALQIFPTMMEKNRCLIPCAIDQNPYFLLQRDIAKKLGYKKNSTILSKFLPPLTGHKGKMSSSNEDKAILLKDNDDTIKRKINKYAFSGGCETIEEHREKGGDCEVDIAYNYLYYLFCDDDKEILEIKEKYESGAMLSGEIKKILIGKICEFLKIHRGKISKKSLDKMMFTGDLAKEMWEE